MAQGFNKSDFHAFNKIAERPVDILYGGKLEIISLTFKNLPEINCNNKELWDTFFKTTWDEQFSTTDDILDFLRHCVYHTGLVGRFYKINCILPLDNVFALLNAKLPNTHISFKVWCKLHKLARLVLKEKYEETALNINLGLDVHVISNSECDNSGSKIKLLNSEDISKDQGHTLIYHITICYGNNDEYALKGEENPPNFNSHSNINSISEDFNDKPENYNLLEHTTCSDQLDSVFNYPTNLTNLNQWEKYGARPKDKQFYKQNCSDSKKYQKRYAKTDFSKHSNQEGIEEQSKQYVSINTENHSRLSDNFQCANTLQPGRDKDAENRQTFKESNGKFLPHSSVNSNSPEFDPTLNDEKNDVHCTDRSSISIPPAPTKTRPIRYDLITRYDFFQESPTDNRLSEGYGARLKELQTRVKDFHKTQENETRSRKLSLDENLIAGTGEFSDQSEFSARDLQQKITKLSRKERLLLLDSPSNAETFKNFNSVINKETQFLQDREIFFRDRVKEFFENYEFSDEHLNYKASLTAIDDYLVKEFQIALPTSDNQTNRVPLGDSGNSLLGISDVGSRTPPLNSDDQNSDHLANKNFEEKKYFD